jgi:hypothetical protein
MGAGLSNPLSSAMGYKPEEAAEAEDITVELRVGARKGPPAPFGDWRDAETCACTACLRSSLSAFPWRR